MMEEVISEVTKENESATHPSFESEESCAKKIKKDFSLLESYLHEDSKQCLGLQIKSERADTKDGILSNNDDIYIKIEPLVSEEPHIKDDPEDCSAYQAIETSTAAFYCAPCNGKFTCKKSLRQHLQVCSKAKLLHCNTGASRRSNGIRKPKKNIYSDPEVVTGIVKVIHDEFPAMEVKILEGKNITCENAKEILLKFKRHTIETLIRKPQLITQLYDHVRHHNVRIQNQLKMLISETAAAQAQVSTTEECPCTSGTAPTKGKRKRAIQEEMLLRMNVVDPTRSGKRTRNK